MPLNNLLKRASSFILGGTSTNNSARFNDGEVVYCKNNVCVHPPSLLRQDCDVIHHPGYLTVNCQQIPNSNKTTLRLSWIPNSTLRRNPWAIEKDENTNTELAKPRPDYHRQSSAESIESRTSIEVKGTPVELERRNHAKEVTENINASAVNDVNRNVNTRDMVEVNRNIEEEKSADVKELTLEQTKERRDSLCCVVHEDTSEGSTDQSVDLIRRITIGSDRYSRSPSITSACSLVIPHFTYGGAVGDDMPAWMSSPELLALQHNLTFPESATASPIVRRTHHRCRRFSVDLSEMRSLRLFFNDASCTCGQLVVASRESQYKILHFHHGGLDHLASVLQEWNFLQPSTDDTLPYRHFMVCRPKVTREELHPEDGLVGVVDQAMWQHLLNEVGQLEDDLALRKGIFFGGLDPAMRGIVWPFLLHCFSYQSTYEDRELIVAIRKQEYEEINRRRLEMDAASQESFWRNIQCVVEKDVVRTDRGNPYFAGENNPNLEVMMDILLNYAVYNPGFGYTQGMSDLLAPVLAEIRNEADTFWCFVGLMHKAIFVCTPTDSDMDRNLCFLRELIRIMVPHFYDHLVGHTDAMELLFCHRWILLCFKREFPEEMALQMWEACWANYLTDYFHLFLCLAIVCVYSGDVIAQDLRTDEMLLHFSSLAMFMDGKLILRKARGLLHQFRQMPRIPCTLGSLCQLCGPGMWDSTHAPVVECVGHHAAGETCPHRGILPQ